MWNCFTKYPDSFEPIHYGSPWIGLLLEEVLTLQSTAITEKAYTGSVGS
jgi:hypothetical protein